MTGFLKKGITLLLRRQTSILSAAYVIMGTVILSQVLGLVRNRLLVSIFGASNILGVYDASDKFPNFFFQVVIVSGLSSAFIPVYAHFVSKNREDTARNMASILLTIGLFIFSIITIFLSIFAPTFLKILNPGGGFTPNDMTIMANLMRIITFGQLLFIIGMFFSTLLQTYNHFLIPGVALATYNLGTIVGILLFSQWLGIYAPAFGTVIGSLFFIFMQLSLVRQIGFRFRPHFDLKADGVMDVIKLMWPRSLSSGVFQFGALLTVSLVSYLSNPGRMYLIFTLAQTLAFAPVALVGNAIAQAAFPVLSREKDNKGTFKALFISSFNQMLYLVLPISALILILRIPIVRLVYGAPKLDWEATVMTGRTLAFLSFSIFAQALIALIYKAFYALHNTKTPLIIGSVMTIGMLILAYIGITFYHLGVFSLAISYSVMSLVQLLISLFLLSKQIGGFLTTGETKALLKLFFAAFCTAVALYIPIKLLDQLVFDTTRTFNLILLTGISSLIGLLIYIFLTWLLAVKEAETYILMGKRLGNWQEILHRSKEPITSNQGNP